VSDNPEQIAEFPHLQIPPVPEILLLVKKSDLQIFDVPEQGLAVPHLQAPAVPKRELFNFNKNYRHWNLMSKHYLLHIYKLLKYLFGNV